MEIEEVHMSASDLLVIIKVSERMQAAIAGLDLIAIVDSLNRLDIVNTNRQNLLLQKFANVGWTSLNEFYAFVKAISDYVPFFGFIGALESAGYGVLGQRLLDERDKVSICVCRGVLKRELPNAKAIHAYYTRLKRCADNNMFVNKTECVLKNMIVTIDTESYKCLDTIRLQLLVDKRCMLYFLLIQQCCCIPERNKMLMRMRDTMPRDVDRTVFDTVFHSCMSFNRAICGDAVTAESHEKQARISCDSCVDGFVKIIMVLWSQYKSNILYLHSECRADNHLNRAKADFEMIQQCTAEFTEDEQNLWKTISVLDMVRATVGIHSKFQTLEVCGIDKIEEMNIQYAKRMLDVVPVPTDMRRRMYYLVLRGRVHERSDRLRAKYCVKEALTLADDGCYEAAEKKNIQKYLRRLECGVLPWLPSPSLTL